MIDLTGPLKWQKIPGFKDYECSVDGEVRRINVSSCFRGKVRLLKPDLDKRGRKRYTLSVNGKARKYLVARLVLLTFVGPCPDGMEACHENGNEHDNRLENLRWDTHSANLLDRRRHGTNVQGEMVNTAKLTADQVAEIRRIGKPLKQHATKFGVSEALVSAILKRKVWTHV